MIGYKIFDKHVDGTILTLFHGVNGSRRLSLETWITADAKKVSDGSSGTVYISGFHFLPSEKQAREYLTKFSPKSLTKKIIIKCDFKGVYPKVHSNSNVWLARDMYIIKT